MAMYIYSYTYNGSGYTINSLDFNDWYVPSTSTYLGEWYGSYVSSLSSWKSTSGRDSNSVNIDPKWASGSNLDTKNTKLAQMGKNLSPVVKDDIYDHTRGTKPCIGAFELSNYADDVTPSALLIPVSGVFGDS